MKKRNLSGRNIRIARAIAGMTQSDLCAGLSVDHGIEMTQNTLSNIERGIRIVNDVELVAFAQVLDVSPQWLLTDDKRRKTKKEKYSRFSRSDDHI